MDDKKQEIINDVLEQAHREAWFSAWSADYPILATRAMMAAYDAIRESPSAIEWRLAEDPTRWDTKTVYDPSQKPDE